MKNMLKNALFYERKEDNIVQCHLCPNNCLIKQSQRGGCSVRENKNGIFYSLIYGQVSSIALDPIEKKPLYHFHPGEFILSVGTKGCNFYCPFCQNWNISQNLDCITRKFTSESLIKKAKQLNSFGIAYTYNEPFIWYEFVKDTAVLAKESGLKNVLVTNGYVNKKPLKELLPYIDAMNIDIKSINKHFYITQCRAKLAPVLDTAKIANKSCHIEITNLIIPTLNDTDVHFKKLAEWIAVNLGENTPLHFSRYFPQYKATYPITPLSTMKKAQQIAKKRLKYVYLGNV